MPRIAAGLVLTAVLVSACGGGERRISAATPAPAQLACGGTFPTSALAPGWRRHSIVAGPVTFYFARDLADQPAGQFRPARAILRDELRRAHDPRVRRRIQRTLRRMPPGGLGGAEMLVLVAPGRTATVTVPASARGQFALVYSRRARDAERPGAEGIIRLADGDRAVRFPACPGGETWQYLGAIIANRPGCVPIDIDIDTGAARPVRRYLPLGTGRHRCVSNRADKRAPQRGGA